MNEPIILAVDDQEEMLSAYKDIFSGLQSPAPQKLFDGPQTQKGALAARRTFTLVTANQGEEAVRIVADLSRKNRAIHAVFLDVRMPPGIDGLETAKRLRAIDPELQIVICTAYSEYPFETFIEQLGRPDQLYYLEKPLSQDEVLQLAHSLTDQWTIRQQMGQVMAHLRRKVEDLTGEGPSDKEKAKGLKKGLLELNDLTGALSSALVRENPQGGMTVLLGTGLLESDQDILRARNNRLPLNVFRLSSRDDDSFPGRLAVLMLQPNQSDAFCRQVVEAYEPMFQAFGLEMENDKSLGGKTSAFPSALANGGSGVYDGEPLEQEASGLKEFHGILSGDPGMHRLWEQIGRVSKQGVPIFISGETGTGKELVARAIHQESPRSGNALVSLNCANLSETMLESQLFGHRKGAFTGAVRDQPGLLSAADGGTLFLDEVSEIPLTIQAKLLRVLQEREYIPLGATKALRFDTQIISASHTQLRQALQEGKFREDLFYRLHVIPLELPPLRDRTEDAVLLFERFIGIEMGKKMGKPVNPEIALDVLTLIRVHDWPGNVRELQNVCAYSVAMSNDQRITLDHLTRELREAVVNTGGGVVFSGTGNPPTGPSPGSFRAGGAPADTFGNLSRLNRETIMTALEQAAGNRSEAARRLGVSRMTLWRHMKAEGL